MSNDVQHAATWSDVAPLLARWQMALLPHADRTWDVLAGFPTGSALPHPEVRDVAFAALPQAILALAAQCAAAAGKEGER